MKYLIDDKIIFIPGDNLLRRLDDANRTAILPVPATLLLKALAETPQQIISREALMEEAWDRNGFRVSGNNLNTYLSVIRNALMELELDRDLIKTLPRQGLILRASTTAIAEETSETEKVEKHETPAVDTPSENYVSQIRSKISYGYSACVVLALVFAALLPGLLMPNNAPQINTLNSHKIGMFGKCSLYEFAHLPPADKQKILQIITHDPHFSSCQKATGALWLAEQSLLEENTIAQAFCSQTDGHYHNCVTYYVNTRK